MEQNEYLFQDNSWFKKKLHGSDGFFWKKARQMFLFNHDLASALNLFQFDYKALEVITKPEGAELRCSKKINLDPNEERDYRRGQAWADDANNSIRTLLDRIVTRWKPEYLHTPKMNFRKLHNSLIPLPLNYVQTQYDDSDHDVNSYDCESALKRYQACLVPLHYHELWNEIIDDFSNVERKLEERQTTINIEVSHNKVTLDGERDSALIFGINRIIFEDDYQPLSKKLSFFDLVLIKIDNTEYFGMIVHVEQIRVRKAKETSKENLKFDLQTTIGIYVSRQCSDLIEQRTKQTGDKQLTLFKLSNITSSRRMISAIHNLHEWSYYGSLLKPTIDDMYFHFPENYDPYNVSLLDDFNSAQSKTITIAECMYHDLYDRMHLVHGPPGTGKSRTIAGIVVKLISKLSETKGKGKILLCAPSNNACDELSRRILDEFDRHGILHKQNLLVRIGCQPPNDDRLCEHFFDFLILKDMVEELKINRKPSLDLAQETENRIMRHAKIVVSTLNYCGSARMNRLAKKTGFLIVDEASQSLEADLLLSLRFKCDRIILVGDPKQLPPCVLSKAGKEYGLSQSLYARLYSIFIQNRDGPVSMLDTQYRMHPEICQFASEHFYFGRLVSDRYTTNRMINSSLKPMYLYNVTDSSHIIDSDCSSFNDKEVKLIRDFCHKLIIHLSDAASSSTSTDTNKTVSNAVQSSQPFLNSDPQYTNIRQRMAVITPYKAQIRRLKKCLPPDIEMMTGDSAQGKEKDIVIISCVRSGGDIGFLNDKRRMNVMLTRPRDGLYVFGNLTQLAQADEHWRALVEYAQRNDCICDVKSDSADLPYR